MKLDFNDLLIVPKYTSDINSRSEVSPYYNGSLPLFTAPMDTVVSIDNYQIFFDNKIKVCFPRGIDSSVFPWFKFKNYFPFSSAIDNTSRKTSEGIVVAFTI